ncbi:hypothetical protein I5J36_gp57 [Mycobacterium phage Mendokysei]|uniref:Uncharacterized protein n=1 Tax=Mycobacterium phage Mendokysei TaxID=2099637 RepID=A0A2P1CGB9_9CAUD|nr:hypothetical protein I5J36_gp57 [Mycobacterium phage Mendokysei]AVJ50273.1 hypothetical protein SEA_MENDOKYSEI_57 [Mycobacterium phage Mendokysei]
MTDTLFASCVLPGCQNLVAEVGGPCDDCLAAFGPMLVRNEGGRRMTAEQIAERDSYVSAAYALQLAAPTSPKLVAAESADAEDGPERRRNQTCWLCEERRTCTKRPQGWECDECRTVDA